MNAAASKAEAPPHGKSLPNAPAAAAGASAGKSEGAAGRLFGEQVTGSLDVCEPAKRADGPAFPAFLFLPGQAG